MRPIYSIFCADDSTFDKCAPRGYISYKWNVGGIGSCIQAKEGLVIIMLPQRMLCPLLRRIEPRSG